MFVAFSWFVAIGICRDELNSSLRQVQAEGSLHMTDEDIINFPDASKAQSGKTSNGF